MTKIGCSNCTSTAPDNLAATPDDVNCPANAASKFPSTPLPPIPSKCVDDCKAKIRVEIPKHAFVYPNFDRIKLATIKDSIHHPRVPAVRREGRREERKEERKKERKKGRKEGRKNERKKEREKRMKRKNRKKRKEKQEKRNKEINK